jgi:hypothetical protein
VLPGSRSSRATTLVGERAGSSVVNVAWCPRFDPPLPLEDFFAVYGHVPWCRYAEPHLTSSYREHHDLDVLPDANALTFATRQR